MRSLTQILRNWSYKHRLFYWAFFLCNQFLRTHVVPFVKDIRARFCYIVKSKRTASKNIFPILTFEPTNICNANCVFCAYSKIKDVKSVLSFELFQKWIMEFIQMGGKRIELTPTVGEALLDTGIFDKIRFAKEQGLVVAFYTNGTLLWMRENYKSLVESGVDELNISIGDVDPNYEAAIYRIPLSLAKIKIKGIGKLIEYNNEKQRIKKISLMFRSQRLPCDIVQEKTFLSWFPGGETPSLSYGFLADYDNWGWGVQSDDLLGVMKMRRPIWFRKYPCIRLYSSISVLSDGQVRLCGCRIQKTVFDDLIIGDIKKQSLTEILTSPKVAHLRESFSKGAIPKICRDCSFYDPYYTSE